MGAFIRDLGQGARLGLAGVALGALGAAATGQVLGSFLYGVSGLDPAAYGALRTE